MTCIRQWKAKLIAVGFQELVFEDAMEIVIDQLNSLGTTEPLNVPQLEANMRDAMLSPMIIMLLRMLASADIQRRSDFFAPFIMVRAYTLGGNSAVLTLLCDFFAPFIMVCAHTLGGNSTVLTLFCKCHCSDCRVAVMVSNIRTISW